MITKKNRLKLSLHSLISLIICATCISPPIMEKIPELSYLNILLNLCALLVFLIVCIKLIVNWNFSNEIHTPILLLTSLFLVQTLSTVINHGRTSFAIISFLKVVTPCLWILINRKKLWRVIHDLKVYFYVLVTANLISILLYPNGLIRFSNMWRKEDPYWILSLANSMTPYILFTMLLASISIYHSKRLRKSAGDIIVFLICLLTVGLADSATLQVGSVIFALLYLRSYIKKSNTPNLRLYIAITLVLFVDIVLLNRMEIFSFLVVNVLQRDLTFTSRIRIWNAAIDATLARPLLGYGIQDFSFVQSLLLASHQHNYYLHILFQGGVVGFFIFLSLIYCCVIRIYRYSRTEPVNKYLYLLSISLFSYFVVFISESYGEGTYIAPFYLVITLCFVNRYFSEKEGENV